ncbi:MAG TPA: diacylglycerol kinase family protein [Nitrososphaeraceae archaeon]|nr:diacylglycerol kinase family protein [Nitrososphaeraceae archaeon]
MRTSKDNLSKNKNLAKELNKINTNEMILLLNPNSQGGNTGKNWILTYSKVKEFLPTNHRIIFTKKTNDGIHVTRKLLRKGYENIVAIGGDGTINEIANGFFIIQSQNRNSGNLEKFIFDNRLKLANSNGVIYIIPSGSRNVLARSLGLKHQGVQALKRIKQMKRRKMDAILAIITDKDSSLTHNRIILNAAEIGVGAEIIDRSKRVRRKIKSRFVSTMTSIVATLPAYNSNKCDIVIDGHKKISSKMTMGIVANGRFLGGGFKAAPRAKFSDGLLDIIILKNSGSIKMLDKLIELKGGSTYKFEDDILYYQASEVRFFPKERDVTVTVDGEPIGMLPAIFKSYHDALTIKSEPFSSKI